MKLILDYWNRTWQSVSYNTENGSGRVRWFKKNPEKTAGWAYKHFWRWYAVWNAKDHLVFQAGKIVIPITEDYKCEIKPGKRKNRIFQISELKTGSVLFKIRYKEINREYDPTFDELDKEIEDFFYCLSKLWYDEKWKNGFILGSR
jgi:hypothetical protein